MAVAETTKTEAAKGTGWLGETLGWGPRKVGDLKTFLLEVRAELKKVTWPGRPEVISTTIVIIITSVFFGFYLWGLDLLFSQVAKRILR